MSSQNREKSLKNENNMPGQSSYDHPTGATQGGASYAKSKAAPIKRLGDGMTAYKVIKKKGYGKAGSLT